MKDSARLFAWRNDPQTRGASHQGSELQYSAHCDWLAAALASETRTIYIAEVDGLPIGTLRADYNGSDTKLSWTIAPEHRGQGFGVTMVSAAVRMIRGELSVEIKITNHASQRIAEQCGFRRVREAAGVYYYVRHDGVTEA